MTEAITKPRAQIDHPAELSRIVRKIVDEAHPIAIYLFGSRARGDGDEDSDYDLMVVVRDDTPDEVLKSKWHFSPRASSVDVKIRRRARFAGRMRRVGTLEHEVVCEGLQLYPPGANPLDFEWARGPQRIASPDVEIVREWLGRASWHLPGAKKLGQEFPETAAFYLQQAAENLTKAVLVAHQIRPPSGHSIGEAATMLPMTYADRDRFLALDDLSDFFWAYRYPSPPETKLPPKPSPHDVETWSRQIKQLTDRFERWLAQREAQP
jgi:uncharacterized protein